MNRESLVAELESLKEKSQNTINQITEHENSVISLREGALIIKGEYQAIEKLLASFVEPPKPSKKKATK